MRLKPKVEGIHYVCSLVRKNKYPYHRRFFVLTGTVIPKKGIAINSSIPLPITHDLTRYNENYIYPTLTFGARFGINNLIDKRYKP